LKILKKYEHYNVGAADFAQFAHNVATVVCPLGPRFLTLIGRPDSDRANPPGKLPNITSPADVLIKLFNDKSTSFVDLVALIGAHTAANQFFVDPSRAGQPFDTTPGVWDTNFYQEVVAGPPPRGVFRLPSDDALQNDNLTAPGFVTFANPATGQAIWNGLYSKSYVRMSLFGVQNINELTDCTRVLPSQINLTQFNATSNTCKSPSTFLPKSTSVSEHKESHNPTQSSHKGSPFTVSLPYSGKPTQKSASHIGYPSVVRPGHSKGANPIASHSLRGEPSVVKPKSTIGTSSKHAPGRGGKGKSEPAKTKVNSTPTVDCDDGDDNDNPTIIPIPSATSKYTSKVSPISSVAGDKATVKASSLVVAGKSSKDEFGECDGEDGEDDSHESDSDEDPKPDQPSTSETTFTGGKAIKSHKTTQAPEPIETQGPVCSIVVETVTVYAE